MAGNLWKKRAEAIDELLELDLAGGWTPSLEWFDEHAATLEQGAYNFSKEIVERYTLRLARPLIRRGLRINSVCPGPIDTPLLRDFRATSGDQINDWMIREMAGRPVSPREVAAVLAFLGSPGASYINGANFDIDGGFAAAAITRQVDYSGRT
jgi:NAD(P)-dependent dehydrogenase (short-subunit alcohol dehydrogenase family)